MRYRTKCLYQLLIAIWYYIAYALLCNWANAADNSPPVAQAGAVRYVWANNLIMRAGPDSKSAEIVKLPFGTAVTLQPSATPLVKQREEFVKLQPDAERKSSAASVIVDGYWQPVHANDHDGWVFDGYLSRYPVPQPGKDKDDNDNESQVDFASRIFGVKQLYQWNYQNGKKSGAAYQSMLKHLQLTPGVLDKMNIDWTYVEFQQGGSYESIWTYIDQATTNQQFKKLPLTFNEALLWQRQFGPFGANRSPNPDDKLGGKFKSGHSLELYYVGDESLDWTLECHAQTCDIGNTDAD